MKQLLSISILLLFSSVHGITIGDKAPDFSLPAHDGKRHQLSGFKGRWVVLEWYNHGCPFVRKHYNPGNMQKLQKKYKGQVVWLTINSSAAGKQGHLASPDEAKKRFQVEKMEAHLLLLDSPGRVGKAYGAKTTPQMFIINPQGALVYHGAIDSIPSTDEEDIAKSKNYVDLALTQALSGGRISPAKTSPYGCSVKY